MTFEIPDVDLGSLTSEELKAHAGVCARVAIDVRKQEMACAFEIIRREQEEAPTVSYVSSYRSYKNPSARKQRTATEILQAEQDEDTFGSINDFR
jgi:hypothetical protein